MSNAGFSFPTQSLRMIYIGTVMAGFKLFGLFCSIFTSGSHPIYYTTKVNSSTNELISDTGQILGSPSSNKHNTMFLQIMAFTLDIRLHRLPIRKFHTRNFTLGGVWLFGFLDVDLVDDAFLCRVLLEQG